MNDKALAIVPKTLPEVTSMAEILAKSNLLPDALKGKQADVVVQILAGAELGLGPMASIRGVHIVQGKPVLAADTMVALCLGSGLCEYFSCVEETATSVTYETKRKGSPYPQRVTWSDEDTKSAGLNTKDSWRLHKRQMRRARAKAMLARDTYADVLAGVYDPDELQVPAREPAFDFSDAEVVSETTAEPPELAQIDAATSLEELNALAPALGKLSSLWKKVARARWTAREGSLPKTGSAA